MAGHWVADSLGSLMRSQLKLHKGRSQSSWQSRCLLHLHLHSAKKILCVCLGAWLSEGTASLGKAIAPTAHHGSLVLHSRGTLGTSWDKNENTVIVRMGLLRPTLIQRESWEGLMEGFLRLAQSLARTRSWPQTPPPARTPAGSCVFCLGWAPTLGQ